MATAMEICAELGFVDTNHQGPTRGLPKTLIHDMKEYVKHRQFVNDATLMANAYLHVANAGEKHWPRVGTPQGVFLAWGADDKRIKDLVIQLFGLIMNGERTDLVVINVDENEIKVSDEDIVQRTESSQSLSSIEPDWHAIDAATTLIAMSQVPDPMTRDVESLQPNQPPGGPRVDRAMDPVFEDNASHSIAGAKDQDQMQTGEHGRGKSVETTKTASNKKHKSAPTDSVVIKKESSRSTVRQPINNEQNSDSESPPLSSLDVVKRTRWPPQYVSPPPPTSRPRKIQPRLTTKRQTAEVDASAPRGLRDESSSPEAISAGPASTSPFLRRSTRSKRSTNHMDDDQWFSTTLAKKPKKEGAKSGLPVPSLPTSAPTQAYPTASTIPINAVFHFFLTDENLGALLVPFAECNNVDKFFARAAAAAEFVGTRDEHQRELAGVTVSLEGGQWPMVLGWNDSKAYEWFMDTVEKAAEGRIGDLHVQVKCIFK